MYKGIRLGAAAAGEHWFVSCFLCFSAPFFRCLCMCLWECVRGDFSLSLCLLDCASFHFFSVYFSPTSTAPHEICKDEHLLSMAWKRASAGETVYNKCPTNATGQSHDALANICSLSVQLSHSWCEYFFVWFSLDWSSLFLFKECFR